MKIICTINNIKKKKQYNSVNKEFTHKTIECK